MTLCERFYFVLFHLTRTDLEPSLQFRCTLKMEPLPTSQICRNKSSSRFPSSGVSHQVTDIDDAAHRSDLEKDMVCLWWQPEAQAWEKEGCSLIDQINGKVAICMCNHLTNFTFGIPTVSHRNFTENSTGGSRRDHPWSQSSYLSCWDALFSCPLEASSSSCIPEIERRGSIIR